MGNQFNPQPHPNKPTHNPTLTQHYYVPGTRYVITIVTLYRAAQEIRPSWVGLEVVKLTFKTVSCEGASPGIIFCVFADYLN